MPAVRYDAGFINEPNLYVLQRRCAGFGQPGNVFSPPVKYGEDGTNSYQYQHARIVGAVEAERGVPCAAELLLPARHGERLSLSRHQLRRLQSMPISPAGHGRHVLASRA